MFFYEPPKAKIKYIKWVTYDTPKKNLEQENQHLIKRIQNYYDTFRNTKAYNESVKDDQKVSLETLLNYFEECFQDILDEPKCTCACRKERESGSQERTSS